MSVEKEISDREHPDRLAVPKSESRLYQIVSSISERDAELRYREEAADNHVTDEPDSPASTGSEDDEQIIVAWEENDPENPYNWSTTKKMCILGTTMMLIINSTMGSALPSNAIPFIAEEWHVESQPQKVLPMSVYLIGYVFGPIFWAPLSEQYGRRWISVLTYIVFMIWTMACALAPSWTGFLFFRLFCGVFASAPIAVVTGYMADIFGDPLTRGRAVAAFMATTLLGPLWAPIISGYASPTIGWRWTFWIALIYAGAVMVPTAFLPETYAPVLLQQRAARMRRQLDPKTAAANVVAPHELERPDLKQLATRVLTRPLRMIAFELIVGCVCAYVSLCYAIFYMTFQAFPLVFQGIYGLSPGACGLVFLAIGAGAFVSIPIFFAWDWYLLRAIEREAPWTRKEEYRRLPLACLGGPLFVISLFWLGWSARADVSFVVPMLAGVPFGMGFMLIFMALLNYLTDAYEIFAASANGAASGCRALLATVLPLASEPMFTRLGIAGGCSLLGGLSLLMCLIPFAFIWKGERIRAGSRFCIALRERKEEMARKVEEQRRRRELRERRRSDMEQSGLIISKDETV